MANIKVGIKFRPLLASESNKKLQWIVEGRRMKSMDGKHNLAFENVFDENASTEKMYKVLAHPVVSKALQGYNGTIFAYGQTSSGKTFSMIGDDKRPGIIPLTVDHVFKEINEVDDRQFLVRIGYIEIYNDKVYDLFDRHKTDLNVFEVQGNVVINQKEFVVKSKEEVSKHFRIGNKNKRIVETATNARSSRSHTIFRITVESRNVSDDEGAKVANLYLVDLAGSEKPDLSQGTFREGLHINKSLLALGKIIRELSKKSSNMKHINFRECKLTRILSPALGGNSLTSVICTVSPSVFDETYRTICFAQNAKKAKTYPTINSANRNSMMMKSVRFDTTNSPQILDSSLKRRSSSTPIGSQVDLCPRKKVKVVQPHPKVSTKSIVYQHKTVQSLKVGITNVEKKTVGGLYVRSRKSVEKTQKQIVGAVVASDTFTIESSSDKLTNNLAARDEDKDETIKELRTQLLEAQNKINDKQNSFKILLSSKHEKLERLERMFEEKLSIAEAENKSLKNEIQLFEKAIFEKETELKSMERRMCEAEQETTEIRKNYDGKFNELRTELGSLLEERNETVKALESQVSDAMKQVHEKKEDDLKNYIQLEKYFEAQLLNSSKSLVEMQSKFEGELKAMQIEFKKKIDEKDFEIQNLKLAKALESNSDDSDLINKSIAKQISDLSVKLCESIKDMSHLSVAAIEDTFIERLGKIFQEVQKVMKKLESLVNKHSINPIASPPLIVPSPPSEPRSESGIEQSPGSIKGGTCRHCKKSFARKAALDRHMLIKHSSKEQQFECAVCNEVFKTKSAMNSHTRKTHRDHA